MYNRQLGTLPNLYAMLAHSDIGLDSYLQLHHHVQSLSIKERVIVGLVVSALNESSYCLETQVMIAKLNGFSEEQINEIKSGSASFNKRYQALLQLSHSIVGTKGDPQEEQFTSFYEAGYTHENLVDMIICIGDTLITNLLTRTMNVPSDCWSHHSALR